MPSDSMGIPTSYRLASPERFPAGAPGNARQSATVIDVFKRSDASWSHAPQPEDLQNAIEGKGDREERVFIMGTYLNEARFTDIILAHSEGAYSWRELAEALHRDGLLFHRHFATLNEWAGLE